jgi:arginine repressor
MTATPATGPGWAPTACTLPTAEQPLRIAEFEALFADHVQQVSRQGATTVLLTLSGGPQAAAEAADLAARETGCCSFITFDLRITDGTVTLAVRAGDGHADVVAALADRAESLAGAVA